MEKVAAARIDVNKPPFDLSSFFGRYHYYRWITNPKLGLVPSKQLYESRDLLNKYKNGEEPVGTKESDIRNAQQQVLSAFHPDSGVLQNVFGRMSFQVPGGMILIGAMITFYKSTTAIVFWQWANQSFNALVNYTNSNATTEVSTKRLVTAYVSATSSALVVALGLKRALANHRSVLLRRFVPFAAVAAANAVNIPLMRQSELVEGVSLYNDEGNQEVIKSRFAAIKGISQVTTARIIIAAPSMIFLPILMERLDKTKPFRRFGFLSGLCQVLFSGMILMYSVPFGCALFPQKCSVSRQQLNILDHKKVEELKKSASISIPDTLYFNKGL